jgi:hypothetical protein
MTATAALALIAHALALPWTRTGWQSGGRAMTRLIHHRHGHDYWCHHCLHSQDDGAKDNGRGDRRGCHINIWHREEVGHHNSIGVEQQKQNKNKNKNKMNNSGGNVTASAPADSYPSVAATVASV